MSYEEEVNAAELHFQSSFQGYPTHLLIFFAFQVPGGRWPGGQVARRQAAGGRKKNIGKWGIPEKSFENVAQLR